MGSSQQLEIGSLKIPVKGEEEKRILQLAQRILGGEEVILAMCIDSMWGMTQRFLPPIPPADIVGSEDQELQGMTAVRDGLKIQIATGPLTAELYKRVRGELEKELEKDKQGSSSPEPDGDGKGA